MPFRKLPLGIVSTSASQEALIPVEVRVRKRCLPDSKDSASAVWVVHFTRLMGDPGMQIHPDCSVATRSY